MGGQADRDQLQRVDYRGMIAWRPRLEREAPFLLGSLAGAPEKSVLDLGCGTGEHADYLAERGYRVLGIDRSEAQIAKAVEYEGRHGEAGPSFLHGDLASLAEIVPGTFGAAVCLGNGLPYLEDEELERMVDGLSRRLVPGGRFIFQVLNYERIKSGALRHLPLNFRGKPAEPGETVFIRLMTPDGDRHVRFNLVTLALQPGREPPVALETAREFRVRAWVRRELETVLGKAGFDILEVHGDMTGGEYEPESSSDLVMVAALRG